MFTGLIQRVGTLRRRLRAAGGTQLEIDFDAWPEPLAFGESVAVQGACLTVASSGPRSFLVDVLDETLDCTTLGACASGTRLNLERALRLSDRLGGHVVSGHVDGLGRIADIQRRGRDSVLRIACEPAAMSSARGRSPSTASA
jgi:riboflavin synthase